MRLVVVGTGVPKIHCHLHECSGGYLYHEPSDTQMNYVEQGVGYLARTYQAPINPVGDPKDLLVGCLTTLDHPIPYLLLLCYYKIELLKKNSISLYFNSLVQIRKSNFTSLFGKVLIIVPKKAGNAPIRNRIRRSIKELFWKYKIYQKGYSYVFFVHSKIVDFNYLEHLYSEHGF